MQYPVPEQMHLAGTGDPPAGGPGGQPGGMLPGAGGSGGTGSLSSRADLALAAGFVVVTPGCRGRDNKADDGTFYGKAPAAIVDLKAAVRYLRHNKGILPGNVDQIISVGCSAGGAVSALLGSFRQQPAIRLLLKRNRGS